MPFRTVLRVPARHVAFFSTLSIFQVPVMPVCADAVTPLRRAVLDAASGCRGTSTAACRLSTLIDEDCSFFRNRQAGDLWRCMNQ